MLRVGFCPTPKIPPKSLGSDSLGDSFFIGSNGGNLCFGTKATTAFNEGRDIDPQNPDWDKEAREGVNCCVTFVS